MLRHRKRSMLLVGACLLAACANGCGAGDTLPPTTRAAGPAPATTPPASSTTSTTAVARTTTTAAVTTVPATAPATTEPAGLHLSADGPWHLVDSAPGITTPGLVYELMPKLWVYLPTHEDIPNGIVWTLHNPEDVPVIEAYLQARLVYFKAITSNPMDLNAVGWKQYYLDGGASLTGLIRPRRDAGQTAELDIGVILRPEVIGDQRSPSEAVVFDCVLDGGYFLKADGSLAEGSVRGVVKDGVAYRLKADGGAWRVVDWGSQPEAC